MTLVSFTGEERNQRMVHYIEDDTVDLWLVMVDFVSYAKELDKTLEEARGLLESVWKKLEIGTTQ